MKTKVLMFGWEFPPHNSGGLGTACFGLTRALVQEGVEVVFVLPRNINIAYPKLSFLFAESVSPDVYASSGQSTGFSFMPVNSILSPYLTTQEYSKKYNKSSVGEDDKNTTYENTLLGEVRRYACAAQAIARQDDFDIIHAHDWLSFLAGVEAKKISGKPLILHVHATEFDRTGNNGVNQEIYNIEKFAMNEADAIIAVSQFTKDKIVTHYRIPPENIEVVHNGIDMVYREHLTSYLDELKAQGNKVVLSIGRITVQKGIEYFVQSAARVLEYNPKVYFVIVGSGDMKEQIIMHAARLGISNRIIFSPFVQGDSEQLHAIYQSADVYVMPSVSEPFGIGPLESIMNGTPVIISKQSGVSEVLTSALKVDFWDIEKMAHAILAVLTYDTLKTTLHQNAHAEISGLTWKRAAQKCMNIYQKIFHKSDVVHHSHIHKV